MFSKRTISPIYGALLGMPAAMYFMVERPEELDKKYPITGKELRERRDRFFAELDAQNPPPPYSKYRKEPPL